MIYLIDKMGQRIGPFENRENVKRFIGMMALCGEDWADHKIVEGHWDDSSGRDPAPMGFCAGPRKNVCRRMYGRRVF